MKKVLLVNTNTEKAPYPIPPLGLALLKRSIETDYEVRIFDGMFNERNALIQIVRDFAPDYVGFGIRNVDDVVMGSGNYYLDDVKENFIDPIRKLSSFPRDSSSFPRDSSSFPRRRESSRSSGPPAFAGVTASPVIILGGGAFSMFPVPMLELFQADYGVVGEGETSFKMLLDTLERGGDPNQIPGVISRIGSPCIKGTQPPSLKLRRSGGEVPLQTVHSEIDTHLDFEPYRQRSSYPVQTKRGCNQKCIYCSYPAIEGSTFRLRSPEDVVSEIEGIIQRLGDVTIEFVDSTFNSPKGHAEKICREIVKRGLRVRLRTMGVNPGGITEELLTLMKRAGFAQIDCTPDSGSPKMLKNLQKNFSLEQLRRAANLIKELQMPTMWFFIFGGPGETEETVKETFDFIDEYVDELDMVHMTEGLRIFPGTKLAEIAIQEGVIEKSDDLLRPVFYVSKDLGRDRLSSLISSNAALRPNCVPALESSPSPEMLRQAAAIRAKENLTEPMFRTLLRIRKETFVGAKPALP